jgi:hypothetical protein
MKVAWVTGAGSGIGEACAEGPPPTPWLCTAGLQYGCVADTGELCCPSSYDLAPALVQLG